MWVASAFGGAIAFSTGFLTPFGVRLQATSLWAGKALVSSGSADLMPSGFQPALMHGWPSHVGILIGLGFVFGPVLAATWHWWALFAALLLCGWGYLAGMRLLPTTVDWYLSLLLNRLRGRASQYARRADSLRAEAATDLAIATDELRTLYAGHAVSAPTMAVAQAAPYGGASYLLDQAFTDSRAS